MPTRAGDSFSHEFPLHCVNETCAKVDTEFVLFGTLEHFLSHFLATGLKKKKKKERVFLTINHLKSILVCDS